MLASPTYSGLVRYTPWLSSSNLDLPPPSNTYATSRPPPLPLSRPMLLSSQTPLRLPPSRRTSLRRSPTSSTNSASSSKTTTATTPTPIRPPLHRQISSSLALPPHIPSYSLFPRPRPSPTMLYVVSPPSGTASLSPKSSHSSIGGSPLPLPLPPCHSPP